ncbi:uncharacterized protein [Drosophila virilis]|uniref:Uncharacterized protein n=1 Tax=Drosophila virilis TaxID=7244 RepID=A0A0Q9W962_DROVI|nr:uncharacterized protein LOC26531290 [Drosophila virilis]KRF81242.1 uncharacterized protein Dvir_GJ26520 [Drosophila virilis]
MKRTACKQCLGPEESRRQAKRKGETVKKTNSWIFKKPNAGKTTWLTTNGELIGVQNKHIAELGINIYNYEEPYFIEVQEKQPKVAPAEQNIPPADVFELIRAQCLYQVIKLNMATKISKDGMQPSSGGRIGRERTKRIKPNTKVFKSYKLEKLLSSEHVHQISSRVLLERIKTSAPRKIPRPSRIVKKKRRITPVRNMKRQKKFMQGLRQNWRKKHNMSESMNMVYWIRVEQQNLAAPKLARFHPGITIGSRIDFELINVESTMMILKETCSTLESSKTKTKKLDWAHLCFFILVVLIISPYLVSLCTWSSKGLESGSNETALRLAIYICHIILLVFVKSN